MKILLRSLFIFVILIGALVTFLLTPAGLQFTIDSVSPFLPGKLTIKKISGVIVGPLTLEQIHYQDTKQIIDIKKLHLSWEPLSLFKKEIRINTLKINALHYTTLSNKPKTNNINAIEQLINSIKNHSLSFQLIINHASIVDSAFSDPTTQTLIQLKKLSLHALFTKNKWDTQFSALIEKPKPFQVHFQLAGKPTNYAVDFAITGDRTNWQLTGTGNQENLILHTPNKLLLNGTLNAEFNIHWKTHFQWKAELIAQKINFSLLNPEWIKFLSFHINSAGDNKNSIHTENNAHIETKDGSLQLTAIHKNTWHIKWHIALHSLKNWLGGTPGNLDSHGKIQGDLSNPHFDINVQSRLHDAEKIHTISLNLLGNFNHHTLLANMQIHRNLIHLKIDGHVDKENQWLGKLQQFSIGLNRSITWQLEKTAELFYTKNKVKINNICLKSGKAGNVCIQGEWLGKKITGTAKINIAHFNWLHDWVRDLTIPTGQLIAHLKMNGTLDQPNITGTMNLNHGSIHFPHLNIILNKLSASIISDGKKLNFKAQAFSQQKPITLQGDMDFTQSGFPTQATLTTNKALIVNTDEYKATITSDLMAKIKNRKINITGNITIPTATISPNDFQMTTTLPIRDVVYVGESAPSAPFWSINTNIGVTIGNAVNVKQANIAAQLGGALHLSQSPTQSNIFATGEILIRKGTFDLYGQTLTISPDSYLTYTNNLLDNPELNIKASREINAEENMGISNFTRSKLKVGVELRGSAKDPRITFFSNRARLAQADILSYLLLGYANTSNTPGNTDFLLRALAAVKISSAGLLGKQNIVSQIQSGLGLNEMGVESDTTTDALGNPLTQQSSFVVGKNLTRKIYVRTSTRLLDPVTVYALRYLLDNHWTAQINSSSLGVGADVLYTTRK
ncbi:MAG: hypothetical protein A3E82_04330 [Gammaproteobacteria bacterium RIFCSPHIGHO2_12_FULL_38_11]|nr:MAG: hypothetical protein A3E82_04330 [Gammaproteobacteria bacterium RIFCSPHIGHO2_12_FULL_38_11]